MLTSFPLRRLPTLLLIDTTDAALAKSLLAHEPGASDILFDRYGRYVERVVVGVVGFDPEVPDLVNEVFARALGGIHQLRESSALKGWIGSIALFTSRMFLRSRSARRRWLCFISPDDLPDAPAPVAPHVLSQVLDHARALLDMLPADERSAFALRFIDGFKLAEIAEMAGVSLATIKRRLVRAERRFQGAARRDPLLCEHIHLRAREQPTTLRDGCRTQRKHPERVLGGHPCS